MICACQNIISVLIHKKYLNFMHEKKDILPPPLFNYFVEI